MDETNTGSGVGSSKGVLDVSEKVESSDHGVSEVKGNAVFGPHPTSGGHGEIPKTGTNWGPVGILLGLSLVFFLAFISATGMVYFWKGSGSQSGDSGIAGDFFDGGKIGIVELKGVIMDSKKVLRDLKQMERSREVKAVVIRLNSPGGSVAPSQEVHDAVKNFSKPIVASMGSVAASGAFYVAVAADKVFANAGTLTGSIGVIMEFANLSKLYEWAKIERYALKTGKYKDSGAEYKPMDPESRTLLQGMIEDVLGQFKGAVAEGRKLKPEEVDAIADGRIFSGKQAKELRLVDELGGIELAVQAAAKLGKIEGDPKVVYPSKPRGNPLIELLSEGDDEDAEGRSTGFASSVRGSGDLLSLLRGVAGQVARETQEPGIYWLWKAH
jgi:protease-4